MSLNQSSNLALITITKFSPGESPLFEALRGTGNSPSCCAKLNSETIARDAGEVEKDAIVLSYFRRSIRSHGSQIES